MGQLATDHEHHQADDTDDALAIFGLCLDADRQQPQTAWLWPDNVPMWNLWANLQTQWRYAGGGMQADRPTGLDYASTTAKLQALGYHPRRRGPRSLADAVHAIEAMEHGALDGFAQLRKTR